MYCDEIGKNIGTLLHRYSGKQSVTNNCLPGNSFGNILNLITKDNNIHSNTTLLIFMGNIGTLNKLDLIRYHDIMNGLTVKKIILFSFPYCPQLSQTEKGTRYKLNLQMYNLCAYNKNIHIIDTSKYASNFCTLNRGKFYLNHFCRRQIAMSLSYYFDISTKNSAGKPINFQQRSTNLVPITLN
jgi:hypothetical protein